MILKLNKLGKLVLLISIICVLFNMHQTISANGANEYGPGSETGAATAGCDTSQMVSTCHGATWIYYTLPNSVTSAHIPGNPNPGKDFVAPGDISNCAYGGYWRHGMVATRAGYAWSGPTAIAYNIGDQVGIIGIGGYTDSDFNSEVFYGGFHTGDHDGILGTHERSEERWNQARDVYLSYQTTFPTIYTKGWSVDSSLGLFCAAQEPYSAFEVTSEVQGKKTTDPSYGSLSPSYESTITNGNPTETDSWDINFKHTVTVDGEQYIINGNNPMANCPSGYACSVSTTNHNPSLTIAGTITGEETLTVTKNGTTKTSSASYIVSKSTQEIIDESETVTYDTECSTSSANPYTINATETTADVTFVSSAGSLLTSISTWPQSIKDYINDNLPKSSDYSSVTETRSLNPGESQTVSHTFKQKKYTIYYKKTVTTQPNGSTTVEYNNFSHTVSDGNNASVCPDIIIYREAEANIQIKNKITIENNIGTAQIPSSNPKETPYTDTSNTSVSKELSPVYAGSYDNDSLLIKTTRTIKTQDGIYGTSGSIDIPWSITGSIENIISQTTNLESGHSDVAKEGSKEIKNTDLQLGTYQTYTDTFESNDTFTIRSNGTPDPTGNDITAEVSTTVYRPWNYRLSFQEINSGTSNGMIYANQNTTTVTVKLQNDSNTDHDTNQPGNPSYSPELEVKLHKFTIPDNGEVTFTDGDSFDVSTNGNNLSGLESKIQEGHIPSTISNNYATRNYPSLVVDPDSNKDDIEFSNISIDANIGEHVCFYLTANHTNSGADTNGNTNKYYGTPNPSNLYSPLSCFTVASQPTFQVRGGSLFTEGDIKAKKIESNGKTFGSWVDYGIAVKGLISQLSSGKALNKDNAYGWPKNHPLTIANDIQEGGQGEPRGKSNINISSTKDKLLALYKNNATRPNAVTLGPSTDYDKEVRISNTANYTTYVSNQFTTETTIDKHDPTAHYRYTYIDASDKNTVIIQDSPLPKSTTHVIYSTGNIVIGNNLTYENNVPYSIISEIPQYIIISDKNIYIDKSVTEIHAWLIAIGNMENNTGEINTCTGYTGWSNSKGTNNALHQYYNNGYSSPTYYSGACDNRLTINGPVFAKNIWLERTTHNTSTGTSSVSEVSEIINLTAENYYWALAKAREGGKISTAYNRSLAPRL